MSNILLVNDNVQDYQTIIDACKDNTYAVTYNQGTDTYDSIFKKYENIVLENNIQIVNHLALVSHGSNNPEFTFLEKENKMLISQYLPDLSNCASCQTNETEDNDLSLNNIDELFDNTLDIHKYIVDLSLNLISGEFDTGKTYTSEDIFSIFKDSSCNAFDMVASLPDTSSSDAAYSITYIQQLIDDVYYKTTNTSHEETFDVATTDLSVNTPDIHKYIVDLSLNLTQEEFNTKDFLTNEDIHSIFKDVSHDVFEMVNPLFDISGDEYYPMLYFHELIQDIYYYLITYTSENADVLADTSSNEYILNTLDTWSTFKEFIKKFNIQTSLDFLGCAPLQSSDWKYTLETLETEQHLNLNIRASDDDTGNLKVGADWVLETDNVNIKELYFYGESIEKWYYTLSWPTSSLTVPQNNIKFSELYVALLLGGVVPGSYSNISFTSIRNTALIPATGSAIPSLGAEISIGSDFKGRNFASPLLSGSGGNHVTYQSGFVYHKFTSNGTFTLNSTGTTNALYYLVVGGGGGGGDRHGGGGGGGGVVDGSFSSITGSGQIYNVDRGGGGARGHYPYQQNGVGGAGARGGDSYFTVSGVTTRAYGGGGGGTYDGTPSQGTVGSAGGGGGRSWGGQNPNNVTSGQGHAGGQGANPAGGGGGGAGGAGAAASNNNSGTGAGGIGFQWMDGNTYGGGGGGARHQSSGNPNPGGLGGGGDGVWNTHSTNSYGAEYGGANTGGGGGGTRSHSGASYGGNGGTGVVIFAYQTPTLQLAAKLVGSGGNNVIDVAGVRYHKFTSNGTFTLSSGGPKPLYYLIVGGGGGGGDRHGGGGGGGGVVDGSFNVVGTGQTYSVVRGGGGARGQYPNQQNGVGGAGGRGGNSSFSGVTTIAYGGGGGGTYDGTPSQGTVGSGGGGGGNWRAPQGNVTYSQGNAGGWGANPGGGGGGGAGGGGASGGYTNGPAANTSKGGDGVVWMDNNYYGGGGGGARYQSSGNPNPGGLGGGGDGVWNTHSTNSYGAEYGGANTGGGGGGCRSYSSYTYGGNGGTGVVILAYEI